MSDMQNKPGGEVVVYRTDDGRNRILVRLEGETVWLPQIALANLFETTKQNIGLHIRNIFEEGELEEDSVVKEYLTTAADGKRYSVKYYNLDRRKCSNWRERDSQKPRPRKPRKGKRMMENEGAIFSENIDSCVE
ncbi:MAG: hypothetical protein AB1656_16025 [Candidatus Omnitrophota bacterium]